MPIDLLWSSESNSKAVVVATVAWQSIESAINALIGIEQVALAFGGWLIGLLALAGLGVLVGRRMTEQSKRVGLLKAVGATPMTVAGVLLFEAPKHRTTHGLTTMAISATSPQSF